MELLRLIDIITSMLAGLGGLIFFFFDQTVVSCVVFFFFLIKKAMEKKKEKEKPEGKERNLNFFFYVFLEENRWENRSPVATFLFWKTHLILS